MLDDVTKNDESGKKRVVSIIRDDDTHADVLPVPQAHDESDEEDKEPEDNTDDFQDFSDDENTRSFNNGTTRDSEGITIEGIEGITIEGTERMRTEGTEGMHTEGTKITAIESEPQSSKFQFKDELETDLKDKMKIEEFHTVKENINEKTEEKEKTAMKQKLLLILRNINSIPTHTLTLDSKIGSNKMMTHFTQHLQESVNLLEFLRDNLKTLEN
jgi:hypothetical protein